MQYHKIPHSTLEVSKLCLGTMTYGEQNSEAEAHQQLDYALEQGINFIDTAEMYPVPPRPQTQGKTEQYLGSWLARPGNRERVIVATKVAAPGRDIGHIRDKMALDHRNIQLAVDSSLERLNTDYIDLYQIHWPQRPSNYFGQLNYSYPAEGREDNATPIIETLEALQEQVRAGKIRYIGVSNETPWGVMHYLHLADKHALPRIVTVQNPYSLLNRSFEVGLAEVAHREGVELLAYSPMAFGALSGKYLDGRWPDGARMTLFSRFSRYFTEQGIKATEAYVKLARKYQLDPAQMALAFVNQQPFVASNIIGATTMEQLRANIDSMEVQLSDELLGDIEAISTRYPNPCP